MPRNPEGAEQRFADQAARFQDLLDVHPDLAYRMLLCKLMLEHRRIDEDHLATFMHKSKEWVYLATRASSINIPGHAESMKEVGRSKTSYETAHLRLDDLEEGITQYTEYHGGVYASCGCTTEGIVDLVRELSTSRGESL